MAVVEFEICGPSMVERTRIDRPRRCVRCVAARAVQICGERRFEVWRRMTIRARRRRQLEVVETDRSPLLARARQRVATLAREVLVCAAQLKSREVVLERCSIELDQTLPMIGVAFRAVTQQPPTVHESGLSDPFCDRGMASQALLVGDRRGRRVARRAIFERGDSTVRARQRTGFDEFACACEDVGEWRHGIAFVPCVARRRTHAARGRDDQHERAKPVHPALTFVLPATVRGSLARSGSSRVIAAGRSSHESTVDGYWSG